MLSGSVLSVWSRVESVLASMPGGNMSKMQIVRLRTDDGLRIVGKWQGVVGVTGRGSESLVWGANRIDRQYIYRGWGGGCHMSVDGFEFIFIVYAPACL